MANVDQDISYLQDHRIPDVLEHLTFAILKEKPADHALFAKRWLQQLNAKMSRNGVNKPFGINLNSIDGRAAPRKSVNIRAPADGDNMATQAARAGNNEQMLTSGPSSANNSQRPSNASKWSALAGNVEGSKRTRSARALKELIDKLDLDDHPAAHKFLTELAAKRASDSVDPNNVSSSFAARGNTTSSRLQVEASAGGMMQSISAMGSYARGVSPASTPHHAIRSPTTHNSTGSMKSQSQTSQFSTNSNSLEASQSTGAEKVKRRIAVSAAPVEFAKVAGYKPKEIPKSEAQLKTLRECVASSTLFASFESDEREVVVMAMHREEFPVGQDILTQGAAGRDTFYLITEGTVEIIKDSKVVASLTPGQYFGELELMYDVPSCQATVRAVTAVTCFALEKDTYQNIVLSNTMARRNTFLQQINKVAFLQSLSDYDKNQLADALSIGNYGKGDYLIRCGEGNQWMYFIMDGAARVVGRKDGKMVDIVTVGPGDVVGELEFLFNHEAVADVVADGPVKVAKLGRKHFEMCMGPVSDNLKEFISQGNYEHYLTNANSSVKQEIEDAERRKKARAASQDTTKDVIKGLQFAEDGEVVFGTADTLYRFPLSATQQDGLGLIGLTEDGTVVFWSDVMARVTHYKPDTVVGQSIFSFLTLQADQHKMHDMVKAARKWAGNWHGFVDTGNFRHEVFTFPLSAGLTKVQFSLCVVPPGVAQSSKKSEVLIVTGHEIKKKLQPQKIDYNGWMNDTLLPQLTTLNTTAENELLEGVKTSLLPSIKQCLEAAQSFRQLSVVEQSEVAESWLPVNVNVMMNRFLTELSGEALKADNRIHIEMKDLPTEEVFMDAAKLPDAIAYLVRNACKHGRNLDVTIRAETVAACSDTSVRSMRYVVEDTGDGISESFIANVFRDENARKDDDEPQKGSGLRKIAAMVSRMGGNLKLERREPQGTIAALTLPLVLSQEEQSSDEGSASGRTFTTVMVEHTAIYRNMMCQHLWGRKHAVLPATTWREVGKLVDSGSCDILIVDPDYLTEDAMTGSSVDFSFDPVDALMKYSRKMAIIISSESYTYEELPEMEQKGFLALPKPCSAALLHSTIDRAEASVAKMREEEERINQLRDTFSKTSRGAHKVVRQLGKGAFGEVYQVEDILTKGHMAMKDLRVKDEQQADELVDEIRAMTSLKHENIIHYFYCEKVDDKNIKIFMELANGGTLQDKVKSAPKGLPHGELVAYLRDMLNGLSYTHNQGYVHCDIKTANVLLDSDGKGKLGDFGTARHLNLGEKMYVMMGTPSYMAPEVMNADESEGIGFDFKADIWSLGVVVMEMATGKPPFSHVPNSGGMGLIRYIAGLEDTPDLSPLFSRNPLLFEFVKACLDIDPEKRPTAHQLLNYSLMVESDTDNKATATKLLVRAKLLHILNKFVAFQEPDTVTQKSKDDEKRLKAMAEKNFFDSDEEEEEDGDAGLALEVGSDGGVDDFFADSDDEAEEEAHGGEVWDASKADEVDEEEEEHTTVFVDTGPKRRAVTGWAEAAAQEVTASIALNVDEDEEE